MAKFAIGEQVENVANDHRVGHGCCSVSDR